MNPSIDRERLRELFQQLCDLPAAERGAFLDDVAKESPSLRNEIESLLKFDEPSNDLLCDSRLGQSLSDSSIQDNEPIPEHIGTYRIIRVLGTGGMGTVYEAQQASPLRYVALKVMRRSAQSREFARRFEREGQIQATLNHPGIAAVYEAGIATNSGHPTPYFAMELVKGVPILEFAKHNSLTTRDRLMLIATVCDAVSYAHQRGVIHRDLKPDNILVERSELGPRAKVLDFGVAKFTNHDILINTMRTQVGQLIGTLSYMSPEQLNGHIEDVDTSSDIYSLGIVLFELLCGKRCHDTNGLTFAEVLRTIIEQEPTRLSSLNPSLRGDIETVVHKAISREKNRRYASASEFAADIRRLLNNEPITARPVTMWYQILKFTQRHRGVVVAATLGVAALIAGIITTSLQARAAIIARDRAEDKTSIAEAVSDVLLNALTVATPKGSQGKEPLLIDAIERIESQAIDPQSTTRPEVRALILHITGIIHRERGDYQRAERNLTSALDIRQRQLDPTDPNIGDSLNNLGLLRKRQERFAEAAVFIQQAVDLQRRSSFQDPVRLARNVYNLAITYIASGEIAKAKPLLEESLRLHKEIPNSEEITGYHISAQAKIAKAEDRWTDALALAEQALAMQRKAVAPLHPAIVNALFELAEINLYLGNHERGVSLLREADTLAIQVFSTRPGHPTTQSIRTKLVAVLRESGDTAAADKLEKKSSQN